RGQLALPQPARSGVDGPGPLHRERGEQAAGGHRDVAGLQLAVHGAGGEHVERRRRPRRHHAVAGDQPDQRRLVEPHHPRDERPEVVALVRVRHRQPGHAAHLARNSRSSGVSRRGRWASRSNAASRVSAVTATGLSSSGPSCMAYRMRNVAARMSSTVIATRNRRELYGICRLYSTDSPVTSSPAANPGTPSAAAASKTSWMRASSSNVTVTAWLTCWKTSWSVQRTGT